MFVQVSMVTFYNISDWEEKEYFNTGGTRNKVVVENTKDEKSYFFKTSLNKKEKNYTYEFWSEVIASEVGQLLGFNVLQYDVAVNKQTLGCLSKSMIDLSNEEQLIEGYKWLKQYQPSYDVENRKAYTFQLIEATLRNLFNDRKFINDIISTLIFDCIIGNEDRHQENWGIIVSTHRIGDDIKKSYAFAPIYDSGSSLGRELREEKIKQMLSDTIQLDAYVSRGKSEVHWKGEDGKQRHFELLRKIAQTGYKSFIAEEINRIRKLYDKEKITSIIHHIDDCLPKSFEAEKIPENRKNLLTKLLTLRIERLLSETL